MITDPNRPATSQDAHHVKGTLRSYQHTIQTERVYKRFPQAPSTYITREKGTAIINTQLTTYPIR